VKRRVLVTGAGGFIGSHLTEALLDEGNAVRALVRYTGTGSQGWLDHLPADRTGGLEIVAGDVCDPAQMRAVVAGCSEVYHLAALIGIPYSYAAPSSYVAVNIQGSLNLLQAAQDAGVERFVQTSTSEVYGSAQFVPIPETHPLSAQSPYAASKIGADQVALSFYRSFGLPVSVIRPFNTFGPRQSVRAIVPAIVTQLLAGRAVVQLGALTPTRDLTYVKDTAAAFVAIARSQAAIGEVVNVGSGFEISIADLFAEINDVVGTKARVELDPARLRPEASEVDRLWADVTKAQRVLEWHPGYAGRDGMRAGLRETVAWFRGEADGGRLGAVRYQV
jgi:dTDP-glucose 4,6-dehydratase